MRSPRVHSAAALLKPEAHAEAASPKVALVVAPTHAACESVPPAAASATVARRALAPLSPGDHIVGIVAPAGFGKTTLAGEWFRACRAEAEPLWIGLDEAWRDPVYFVRSLLERLGASSRSATMGPMDSASAVQAGLLDVLKVLARRDRPVIFFFDDVHLLHGAESAAALNQLLLAAPEGVRFVLCGREGVGFGLAAQTARGLVRWVTQHDLRFTAQDVGELASYRQVAADAAAVDRILELTEGWPALVQLTLASGQVALESAERGHDVLMDSFVYESFFRAMPMPRRQALFIMAAVGEFTAALLQTLGAPESGEAIVEGEQLGIVQRRGGAADAAYFTLHPLIAERALKPFAGVVPDSADALRASSARWWHARGEIHRAIRMAVEGGDALLASGYLAGYARQLVQAEGRHETFLHLLAQVESRGVALDGDLMLQAIWALVFLRRYAEAEVWLARIERACGRARSTAVRTIWQRTLLQRGVIAGLRDDAAGAELFVQRWLAGPSDPDPFHDGAALTVLAYAHKCNARFADAAQCLRKAQLKFDQAPSPYGLMWVRVISAASLLKAGRHRDALADIDSALTDAPAFAPGSTGLVAMLHAIRAAALYERNQCAEAMVAVESALQLLPHQGIVDAMVAGYVTAARLQAARGDLSGALDVAAEGERVGLARGFVRLQLTMAAERALLLLRSGDVEAAQRMASEHGFLAKGPQAPQSNLQRDKAERLWARLDLVQGRPGLALEWADSGIARARHSHQQHKLAELLMLRALVLQRTGDMDAAHDAMAESLRIAAANGYVRLYLDEGAALEGLLRRFVERPQVSSAVVACARALLLLVVGAAAPSAGVPLDQAQPTDRELQILQLLAGGMSNSEVAGRLMLTEGTVKWHMHNLYGKLGVRNRTGALREARARALLGV